jgi:L-ascorbate metabolism protein UlaG (beta-lactamase superfamily)
LEEKMHPFSKLEVPSGAVGVQWFGQSSYALKDSAGTVIQVDPYFPRERPADRFVHLLSPLDETTLPTDFVLLTHNHLDHTFPESCLRIHHSFGNCRFVGPVESTDNLRQSGIPDDCLMTVKAGDVVTLGSMKAHVVYAKPPEGAPEDGIKPPDVQHFGLVVEAGGDGSEGVRVYFSGDPINTFANHAELTEPVAALRPDIGFLTTHPSEGEFPFFEGSVKMAQKVGVKSAAPSHYQCFVKRNFDAQEWATTFPAENPELLIIPYNRYVVYHK